MIGKIFFVFVFLISSATAFFFGGGGGGGGCSCAPACPRYSTAACPPIPPISSCPQQPCAVSDGPPNSGNYFNGGGGAPLSSPIAQPPVRPSLPRGLYIPSAALPPPQSPSSLSQLPPSSYSSGPQPAPALSAGQDYAAPQHQSPSLGVQVPAASYSANDGAPQALAGSKLQEVEEDLDEQMMSEVRAEDLAIANAEEESATLSRTESSTNGTLMDVKPAVEVSLLNLTNDTDCNSDELRKILLDNMVEDLNASKRTIQFAAENQFGGRFDVICSNNNFSYLTNTELFCQQMKNAVSCYAYRQL